MKNVDFLNGSYNIKGKQKFFLNLKVLYLLIKYIIR